MPEKMPYQPTDDEIKKAEEMSPDDSYVKRYGQSEREYILEGKKGGKYGVLTLCYKLRFKLNNWTQIRLVQNACQSQKTIARGCLIFNNYC